ncbi:lanC-like protein 2 [Patiria miniata]|uniref:LanC-like protein 2 n=1 Tax=Patiria miniata TaxID=46514 RepID=A0A913YZG3_PATMI|nr:lanC-like protein 2 [Patiria miniata]
MSKRKREEGEMEPREFTNNFDAFSEEISKSWQQISEGFAGKLKAGISSLLPRMVEGLRQADDHDDSVYTGKTGIALLYLQLHTAFQQGDDLATSYQHLKAPLQRLRGRRHTFLCGDAGPLAVGAVVLSKLGRASESQACVDKLHDLHRAALDPGLPDELLYGRAGYLYALLYLKSRLPGVTIDDAVVERVYRCMIESGGTLSKREKSKSPLMYAWHEKNYVGAAHGMCGILCLLMQVTAPWAQQFLHSHIKPSVDYVTQLAFPSGNFPSSLGNSSDRLVHWCHGAPGAIHMLLQAHKVFGDSKYLEAARRCGVVIWERGLLRKGYGLCHGTAGNAYALLTLYQSTKDSKYLYQACKFAEWCLDYGKHGCRTPDRPFSLFEGMAGTIYFLADLLNPETAQFPALYI